MTVNTLRILSLVVEREPSLNSFGPYKYMAFLSRVGDQKLGTAYLPDVVYPIAGM